ncbi:Xaa-Pro dipeptidase [Glycine max]|nr:Xaa-Pro dipeptidase [Glycine max]
MAESIRSTSSLDHLEAAITHFAVTLASKASKLDALLLKMNTLVTSQHSPSSSSTKSPPPDTPILTQSPMLILLPCPALMQQIPTHMLAPLPMAASHFPAKSKSHTSSSDFGHLDHARATVSFDNLFSVVLHYDHATAPNDKTLEDRDMTMFDMVAEHHFYGSDMMVAQRCHPADFALWKATKPDLHGPLKAHFKSHHLEDKLFLIGQGMIGRRILQDRMSLEVAQLAVREWPRGGARGCRRTHQEGQDGRVHVEED